MRVLYLTLFFLLPSLLIFAQKKRDLEKYNERAISARSEVWAWDIKAFKQPDLTNIDTTQSAVILAKHIDVKVSSSKKLKASVFGFYVQRDIFYATTVREMVKINDKVALDEYSQFSFKKFRQLNGFRAKATTIIGVRIIKADGTRKEVKVDEEMVTEQEENKQQKSKLAIPDLQVGDIIDYFVLVEEMKDASGSIDQQIFVLGDDKPIKQLSVHCEISDKYAIRYTTANGAPDFKISKDDDGNVFDLLVRNIPALPTQLWMSPYRQVANIRMNVNYGRYIYGDIDVPAGSYRRNPLDGEIVSGARLGALGNYRYAGTPGPVSYVDGVRDMIKIYQRDRGSKLPKDSIPYYVYYAMRYMAFFRVFPDSKINVGLSRNQNDSDNRLFISLVARTLRELDIRSDVVLVTNKYGPADGELLEPTDFEYVLKTRTENPVYITSASVFTHCNIFATAHEGQNAIVTNEVGGPQKREDPPFNTRVRIPFSEASKNSHLEKLDISLDNNMDQLLVDRTTTLRGALREDGQKDLLLFEDYYEEERQALGIRESFMEKFADSRRNKALAEEYTNAFAQARKDQKEAFTSEVKSQFDAAPKELKSYKIRNMGMRHTNPDFVYDTKFTLDGFLKKAGGNYIFDVGRLIGGQLTLKPNQRERKVDMYEPFARSFEHDIIINIPAGYKVEGAEKLVRNVDNACGSFIVSSSVEGNKLHVTVKKIYKHAFEKAESWNSMLQVVDAAVDFLGQKVLLKKA